MESPSNTHLDLTTLATVQNFLATASPMDKSHALNFCFVASVVTHNDTSVYAISTPRDVDMANLVRAGLISQWDLTGVPDAPDPDSNFFGMDPPIRHTLLLLTFQSPSGAIRLLSFFHDLVARLNATTFALTPTGTLVTDQRERFADNVHAAWATYREHLADAAPWPAYPQTAAYARRVRTLRTLRSIFVHIAWYHIGTGRFALARAALSAAAQAVHVPQVGRWKAEDELEEGGYAVHGIDMYVAMVHAFAEEEARPFSTSGLYHRVRRECPRVVEERTVVPPTTEMEMVGGAFRGLFRLLPRVIGFSLPEGVDGEEVVKLIGLAWIDGRWHNRLSIFTVGEW